MSDKDTRWFAPKPFGLGVRILTWQGALVLLLIVLALAAVIGVVSELRGPV